MTTRDTTMIDPWERFQETARPAFRAYLAAAGAGTKWREAAAWARYLAATAAARRIYIAAEIEARGTLREEIP